EVRRVLYGRPAFGQRSMQHRSNRAKHVDSSNDRGAPDREDRHDAKGVPRTEENRHFTREIGKTRQAAASECCHYQGGSDEWKPAQQPAEVIYLQCSGLLIDVAVQTKSERGKKSMRYHHEHCACDADEVQGCNPQEHKSHVCDTRISDEPIEVL